MMPIDRRSFIAAASAGVAGGLSLPVGIGHAAAESGVGNLHLARFRFDVTPPLGHSLCGGWIKPVEAVDDPLEAIGLIILGAGQPIVICAVDWTGLLNDAHVQWRTALAEAAGTTPHQAHPPPIDAPGCGSRPPEATRPRPGPPLRSGPSEQARLGATGERLPQRGA